MRDKIYALLVEKCEGIECDCDVDMSCEECKGPIADAILALEVNGKMKRAERCKGFHDDKICQGIKNNDCPARCLMPPKPMTINDLIEVK